MEMSSQNKSGNIFILINNDYTRILVKQWSHFLLSISDNNVIHIHVKR